MTVKVKNITPGSNIRAHFYHLPPPILHTVGLAPIYHGFKTAPWFNYLQSVVKGIFISNMKFSEFGIQLVHLWGGHIDL